MCIAELFQMHHSNSMKGFQVLAGWHWCWLAGTGAGWLALASCKSGRCFINHGRKVHIHLQVGCFTLVQVVTPPYN
jgi:hypothetical protein